MKKTFDFIIVGAGSAGAVIANRLATQTNLSIALVEAGPVNNSAFIHAPMGISFLIPR
jgi:choline dehydrogenase